MAAALIALLCALAVAEVARPAAAQAGVSNRLNKPCSEAYSCYFASLSCKNDTCVCAEGYHQYRNNCLAGVGWSCNNIRDCVPGARCGLFSGNQKYCTCMHGTTKSSDGSRCEGEEIIPGSSCQWSSDCEEGAFCDNKDGHCKCIIGKVLVDGQCIEKRGLGDECASPGVRCSTARNPHLIECEAQNQTCSCVNYAMPSQDGTFCENSAAVQVATSLLALIGMYTITRIIST